MKSLKWLWQLGAGLALLVIGVALGIWFASNYEIAIVPRIRIPPAADERFGGTTPLDAYSPTNLPPQAALDGPAESLPRDGTDVGASVVSERGPFTFRFTPGERLSYRLNTQISGGGIEMMTASSVGLTFDSLMTLATKSVDAAGNADLCLTFDEAYLRGDFMGSPYEMRLDQQGAYVAQGNTPQIDTFHGLGSMAGVPQLEFFQHPITMKVAPNVQVLSVSGSQDLSSMLTAMPSFSSLEFPSEYMADGRQWESHILLPVPGFGAPAKARIRNTFVGYEYVGEKYCGVIEQEFLSEQKDGALEAPESALGEATRFSMPLFTLQGKNYVYFDVNNGQLVHSTMDLGLNINIGQMLGDMSGLLGGLTTDISKLLGGTASGLEDLLGDISGQGGWDDLLKLDLIIKGDMALLPPAEAQ